MKNGRKGKYLYAQFILRKRHPWRLKLKQKKTNKVFDYCSINMIYCSQYIIYMRQEYNSQKGAKHDN